MKISVGKNFVEFSISVHNTDYITHLNTNSIYRPAYVYQPIKAAALNKVVENTLITNSRPNNR